MSIRMYKVWCPYVVTLNWRPRVCDTIVGTCLIWLAITIQKDWGFKLKTWRRNVA